MGPNISAPGGKFTLNYLSKTFTYMTSSAKGFFRLLLVVLALAALFFYLMLYQEHIAMVLGGCLMAIAFIFIGYVNFPLIFNYLKERATGIMNVYPDVSGRGLHIFSEFTVSRWKSGLPPLRSIQYYFLLVETHKLYYKILFAHDMESAKGRSGYTDFSSFEEDVLGGADFKAALEEYSIKAGWPLQLGDAAQEGEDESYETKLGTDTFRIETKKAMIQDTMRVCCYDEDGKLKWSKKI
jgi:hypothetical protein